MKKNRVSFIRSKLAAKIISGLAICSMVAICLIPAVDETMAKNSALDGITSDSIEEKEGEIKDLQEEKDRLNGQISDIEKIKQDLEQEKDNLSAYITEIDAAMQQIRYNIDDMNDQLLLKEADITEAEEELAKAREMEQNRYDAMIVRLRQMYEQNNDSILGNLLSATSLHDLLNRMDYIEAIASYDRACWEALKTAAEYVALCEAQLELEKELMEDTVASLETEQASLDELMETKTAELTEYLQDIASKEAEIDAFEEAIADADDEIAQLEAAIEAEKQAIYDELHKHDYDGGSFIFPLASYKYISCKYGWRIHPITGKSQFHSGVDIAANYGTAIYAAYSGTVSTASYSSSMGNYIILNHGGGLFTIYMHCSALYVKEGDSVSTGETIAAVGSTGSSTGNHLHFTVRKDGEYVDPNDYVYFYDR